MIRVLIADDHPVVRRGLTETLDAEPDIRVVGQADSAAAIIELARRTPCDAIVLDVSMPGRGGIDALKDLKHEHPRMPILVLSMYPEDQYAIRALKAGAAGYLTKDAASDALVKAIWKIVAGGRYVSETLAEQLALRVVPDHEIPVHDRLSDREYQVLRLIGAGKTVGEIAAELSLSPKTVSTYRTQVLDKLNLRNNAEIMKYVLDKNLR